MLFFYAFYAQPGHKSKLYNIVDTINSRYYFENTAKKLSKKRAINFIIFLKIFIIAFCQECYQLNYLI